MITVGGVGGSGTRVIAEILKKLGVFMGRDLNESNDTLLFTLLFKRQNILTLDEDEFDKILKLFVKIMSVIDELNEEEFSYISKLALCDRTLHEKEWLQERVKYIKSETKESNWGWKEPNTHIIIEKLLKKMATLKFVYVYRSGLDMAYSQNQNQLKLWGPIFLNDYNLEINPKNSLKYWCITHKKILKLKDKFSERIFMLDFDKLCLSPQENLQNFFEFIDYEEDISEFEKLIKIPSSIGRHKEFSLDDFDKEDVDYAKTI